MPINYLQLQPQITEYCQHARDRILDRPQKINTAISLLQQFAQEYAAGLHTDLSVQLAQSAVNRTALPGQEAVNRSYPPAQNRAYCLLASDGSQIISSHHDSLPIALINTSTVFLEPGSGMAPEISTQTEFIRGQDGSITVDFVPEQGINIIRDVREVQVLANFSYQGSCPLIALGDGPLELFQEPRSGAENQALFNEYLLALSALASQGRIAAGYTDKPRADLVINMLAWVYRADAACDISGITDADIFSQSLAPGERSAIFSLLSPSSAAYRNEIGLHFFYLQVGTENQPWVVRVEITASTAFLPEMVALLQRALLDQCALMSARPYPYILHRAHEEAVVHFDEREKLSDMLVHTLQNMGVQSPHKSNKLDAKELGKRTRFK